MSVTYANPPTICDVCRSPIKDTFYDAQIWVFPGRITWANVCSGCFEERSATGLGTGKGQKFERNEEGEFIETKG